MEAVVSVSLQPSVLDAAVMSYSMLKPGQDVTGTVLSVDTYGVLVSVGKNIRGLVTPFHTADVLLKTKKVAAVGAPAAVEPCGGHTCTLVVAQSRLYFRGLHHSSVLAV